MPKGVLASERFALPFQKGSSARLRSFLSPSRLPARSPSSHGILLKARVPKEKTHGDDCSLFNLVRPKIRVGVRKIGGLHRNPLRGKQQVFEYLPDGTICQAPFDAQGAKFDNAIHTFSDL